MPDQPHVYWQMSHVFAFSFQQIDSLEYYTRKAIDLQPGWILPCVNTAFLLSFNYSMFNQAKYYLELANKIDSNNVEVVHMWAINNMKQKKYTEAERLFLKRFAWIPLKQANGSIWDFCTPRCQDLMRQKQH